MVSRAALLVVLAMLGSLSRSHAAETPAAPITPLQIQRITPEGEGAPPGRQIVIEFNQPVVPIGRMERAAAELPITIAPAVTCQWRWLNTRTLACNLDEREQLSPATLYRLEIRPGIRTVDGAAMSQTVQHSFSTQRPQVRSAYMRIWRDAGRPIYRIYWDQPVAKSSVLKHIYFESADKRRMAIVASTDETKRVLPAWLHLPGEKAAVRLDDLTLNGDDVSKKVGGEEFRRVWLVEPDDALAASQTVALKVEPGIKPLTGGLLGMEARDITAFETFPGFMFVGARCTSNSGSEVLLTPGQAQDADDLCNPLAAIMLRFTSPVARKAVRDLAVFTPPFGKNADGSDVWGEYVEQESANVFGYHRKEQTYDVYLPHVLKAAATYQVTLPGRELSWWEMWRNTLYGLVGKAAPIDVALQDKFGRRLAAPAVISFKTDHRPPHYVLEYDAAVLEKGVDSDVPIYVNNLDSITWLFDRLTTDGRQANLEQTIRVPKVEDIQFATPSGAREKILGGKSGAAWAELTTAPKTLAETQSRQRPQLFVQVTPFQVHVKLGHFNTLVWVTDMATGHTVPDAEIDIYWDVLRDLKGPQRQEGPHERARTDSNGLAILPGTDRIDPNLKSRYLWETSASRPFVRVTKGKDMALVPIWLEFQIDNYRSAGTSFYPENQKRFGHVAAWGTSAQGIYHPGDTIQYKFYVRNQDEDGFIPAPRSGYALDVQDPTGKVVFTVKDVMLNEFGSASGEFPVAKTAPVGWYNFILRADWNNKAQPGDPKCEGRRYNEDATTECRGTLQWMPFRVLVSDFTPAPFKVRNSLNGDLYHPGHKVVVQSDAKLHSGGPYTQARARVTALLTPKTFVSKHPVAEGFRFGADVRYQEAHQEFEVKGPLNEKGEHTAEFVIDDARVFNGRLMVETAVQDDRGKNVAHQSYADYVGVDRLIGLRLPKWFYVSGDDIAPSFVVVDERGTPIAGGAVEMTLERRERKAARVKSAGNAYMTETETTLVLESACKEVSQVTPTTCHLNAGKAGDYVLKAKVTDTKGRAQTTEVTVWVSGRDYVMWDEGNDTSLDIVPEKATYRVGDTAKYLVKNPYPGAKALVTVERNGVIDSFVRVLPDSAAVIDLPIKPDYLPGFYLSVAIVSPRVDKPLEPGQVDLGKPAFRIGYTRVPISDPYKEIAVTATVDREVYRPRDTVRAKITAKPRNPSNEPVELAIAVVDEAVFDMIAQGRDYYDPYSGFYKLEALDLRNFNLLTRLVGRQKFEKKGANPGGDGGAALNMRSVFKYVSYWNPSLKTDAQGEAEISFTVPDNLTGWRILAIATTPTDRFGLGEGTFKVNRPTEIRPEMPNQVAEGDSFDARFSVMNRTDQSREIKVAINGKGDAEVGATLSKVLTLKPFERALVDLPIKAKLMPESRARDQGEISFTAEAGDDSDRDGITHAVPVEKLRSLDVAASYGTTTAASVREQIAIPQNIFPDSGDLSVVLAPSVIGNVEGAFRYIRDYPYPCWEQLLTRGVMAAQFKVLRAYMPATLTWPEHERIPGEILARAADFQAPNGGMAYFVPTDNRVDPYLSAYTALAFNWLRGMSYAIPETVDSKLRAYLIEFLSRDLAPTYYSAGMSSTVRAVALAALAPTKDVTKADLDRYAPALAQMNLLGKAHFAMAALQVPGAEALATDALKRIQAHGNETSGKFVFSEEVDDSYARILHSSLRDNCAILEMFTMLDPKGEAGVPIGDVPFRLARAITQSRGNRDHWENTQENMFCMNALASYSRVYERETPAMTIAASFGETLGEARFNNLRDSTVTLSRPLAANDAGRNGEVEIKREGVGRLYYATRLSYAPKDAPAGDINAGMEIHREYSIQRDGKWTLLAAPYEIRRGDLLRVDLYVSLPTARNFVVVDDPTPGGLEPVNTDLATASRADAANAKFEAAGGSMWLKYSDWSEYAFSFWSFYHRELRHDAVRFFADYLPAGRYHLSYTAQAIGTGEFTVMPAKAEEMYDPDVYGKTTFGQLKVSAAP